MPDTSPSPQRRPLLSPHPAAAAEEEIHHPSSTPYHASTYARRRAQARALLSSRAKHYFVLALVFLDVSAILADLFIALVACDYLSKGGGEKGGKGEEPRWAGEAREVLHPLALTFSVAFVVELGVTVWAFGWRYFHDWFHCFDAFVITVSFIVDVVTHGIVEDIASIVIILRLWRFVKIIEELSAGAAERMEEIEARVVELERENADLKTQLEGSNRV